jgi:CRP-like cAMP-binding protein
MSIDIEKLREKTQKLLAKKKIRQAIKLYESSLESDPNHPDLWCELGSLQGTAGDADACGASYFRAAEIYVKGGQDRYALAACQKAVKSGAEDESIEGARRLLKVLATQIKGNKRKSTPSQPGAGGAAKSLLSQAASSSRVSLGESRPALESDYAELDATPLPPPLSPLLPIQREQAAEYQREPTTELDLEEYAVSARSGSPFQGDKQLVAAAPPPPPVSYWDEASGERKPAPKPRAPRPRVSGPQPGPTAPQEMFMVLSRRDAGTLLAGLRTGRSSGLTPDELAQIEKEATSDEDHVFRILQSSLLFEGLSREQLLQHAGPDRIQRFAPEATIARTGSGSDRLFSLLSGEAVAVTPDEEEREIARLRPGAIIGEQSFVNTAGMKSRVKAVGDVELVALDRAQAEELLTDHPASLYAMLRVVEERVVDNMLQRAGFFRLFEPTERDEICPRFEILEVADDELIVKQGTPSKTLCLLMSGTIELSHENPEGRTIRMLLDPGGVSGEESLIDGRPQIFTARTTARSWIMLLRREEYLKIYEKHPVLIRSFKDVLRRRRQVLDQVTRGELDLSEASWPDFDPATVKAKQVKPIKDRGPKKNRKPGK